MPSADFVIVDGKYYSPKHPKVLALYKQIANSEPLGYVEPPAKSKVQLSPEEALNKTERAYLYILRERFPYQPIMIQAITLRLAHNTKYTPDFAYALPTGALVFVETKGAFIREDAAVKLKTAAAMFPQFTFIKAQYKKGKWKETVMPK